MAKDRMLLNTVVKKGKGKNKQGQELLAAVVPEPGVIIHPNLSAIEGKKGSCITCGEKGKYIDINLLKSNTFSFGRITTPSDTRLFQAKIIEKHLLSMRLSCKPHATSNYAIDKCHKLNQCMLCRNTRTHSTEKGMCKSCSDLCLGMKRGHAIDKQIFETSLTVIKYTCSLCRDIEFLPEDPDLCVDKSVGIDKLAVDMIIDLTTTANKHLLFVIEIQNTKKESPKVLTHKFIIACSKMNPYRAFLINLRVSTKYKSWDIEEKIDMLRRWMIFMMYYADKLPSRSYWELFQGDCAPLEDNAVRSLFLSKPFVVDFAPKGIKSDWEFATDPYSGYIMRRPRNGNNKDGVEGDDADEVDEPPIEEDGHQCDDTRKLMPWHNIIPKEKSVTSILGASFPNALIGVYNVDNQESKLVEMQCSSGCDICQLYLSA